MSVERDESTAYVGGRVVIDGKEVVKPATSGGYDFSTYGCSSSNPPVAAERTVSSASNPYECFLSHLAEDENPNFLRYTLLILEKHAYAQQAELLQAVRKRMEEKYNLPDVDVWNP